MRKALNLLLQVGTPRTASTTLQRHVFPRIRHTLCIHKAAYIGIAEGGANTDLSTGERITASSILARLKTLSCDLATAPQSVRRYSQLLLYLSAAAAHQPAYPRSKPDLLLQLHLSLIAEAASRIASAGRIMIAAERLSNSGYAINCRVQKRPQRRLPAEVIINAWNNLHGPSTVTPRISACLRDPIPHLSSRYQRFSNTLRINQQPPMSAEQYVGLHVKRHRNAPIESALFPILHRDFISYHERLGDVTVFGFRELVQSKDVLSLIGLPEEEAIDFTALPRENMDPTSLAQKRQLQEEIAAALNAHGYLDKVMKNKLYE